MTRFRNCVTVLVLGLASCDSRPPGPTLLPVTGTIKWKGEILAGANIHVIPIGNTAGAGSLGRTDDQGVYKLKYFRGGDGAVAGEYKVVISRRILPDGSAVPENYNVGPMDSDARESLPIEYSDPDQSTLTATIAAGGAPVDFHLK